MAERQLGLFRGSRTAPSPTELALHYAVADLVRRWIMPTWKFTHIPSGEFRTKATAARLKRMGVVAGWPDFIFVGPQCVLFIELKRRGETKTDEQANVALHIIRSGFNYHCLDRLDDVIAVLREHGVVRARVSA